MEGSSTRSITSSDVQAATARIAGRVRRTPVAEGDVGAFASAGPMRLKLEYLQHAGSFKARGVFNRILAAAEQGELPAAGVVVASGGNAGLAVAYAADQLHVPAEVYVPATAPAVKVAELGRLGARVVQVGTEYAEAYDAAISQAAQTGALFCHAYDQPEMVAGHGSLGLELLEQIPGGFDTVLLAVGGGGLMAGVATALQGKARVVAVEPQAAGTLHAALAAGHPVDVPVSGIAADSLGARRVGDIAYAVATVLGVTSVLVTDQAIIDARKLLWDHHRIVVEHGSAAALAALTSGAYRPTADERLVVLLCGANTSPTDLA
jgi:threonine dehydratase